MTHVITQACCADASCVFACPVNAIHPNPDDPAFATAEMLYIDPATCVDCGACVPACPVGAISRENQLTPTQRAFTGINAAYHRDAVSRRVQARVQTLVQITPRRRLRVAVVGSGPAGLYAADELLKQDGVEVTVFDRLPTPYGLVRSGVAPDHQETKAVVDLFRVVEELPGFHYVLGVEVGTDVGHAELLTDHDAVIYAVGASQDRRLGIAGEDLPGSATATEFVAWYNGHPDHAGRSYDLGHERAVIVGNGNVALDVARILATDPAALRGTDISDAALEALFRSSIREVVVLARRGPAQAAFTLPELTGLLSRPDIEVVVVVDGAVPVPGQGLDVQVAQKLAALRALPDARTPRGDRRRIVLRFLASPVAIHGTSAVTSVEVVRNELVAAADGTAVAIPTDVRETLEAGLVLRSIGYRGVAVPDLPFDPVRCVIPNAAGRVLDLPQTYVVGWIKRGPNGYIGTNKTCAQQTVTTLLSDANAGLLPPARSAAPDLRATLHRRYPQAIDRDGWRRIDAEERARGARAGRPRVKVTDISEMRSLRLAETTAVPRRRFSLPFSGR